MKALIVVDYQYDFVNPLGKLYVPNAETLQEGIENKIKEFKNNNDIVIFSKDWHPLDHVSFLQWGEHCVANSEGAKLMVDESLGDLVIHKGVLKTSDSYSAFYTGQDEDSGLNNYLKDNNILEVEICGVALDVCVVATYNDAVDFGFKTKVLTNLTKAIQEGYVFNEK